MRILLLTLLLISISSTAAVYRWVDENGKVHYGDEAKPNAELVEVKANTQNTIAINDALVLSPTDSAAQNDPIELILRIVSPTHDETIRSNEGKFDVIVNVAPTLPRGILLTLFIDGEVKAQPQSSTTFSLTGIYRGEHIIVVKALDQNGKVLASSSPRKIFLHQANISRMVKPTPYYAIKNN
ncbi:DUF4124 domain-containing protein [Shewanella sp. OMA3-2]|uniref:DUF4124 domain-containing protein n=1 Tax=Shewanella sp. OMA3-2 TaxID=2908650 RepID=UPI001F22AF3C|nr:DUF4124 domain-containing protein [Shewanella sp. OMA3-2]UJF22452.1 DUF4124 domain-containing protein [Shewanella sp. OMA3-2]